jgi:hypothetical protein
MSAGQWCNAPYPRPLAQNCWFRTPETCAPDERRRPSSHGRHQSPQADPEGSLRHPRNPESVQSRTLTQRERAEGGGAATGSGSLASHPALKAVFLVPTFSGVPRLAPGQIPQAPHLLEGRHHTVLARRSWRAEHKLTWARDSGVSWRGVLLPGDSDNAG